jgi:hypothetical protein
MTQTAPESGLHFKQGCGPAFISGNTLDKLTLNRASMAEVIEHLNSGHYTDVELRAALTNAMRRIEQLEKQLAELDDTLFSLYRGTTRSGFPCLVRDEPSGEPVWKPAPV